MKRLLSIWLRNWPIQRLRSERASGETLSPHRDPPAASVPQQPVLLWRNDPRRGRIVVAYCSLAAKLGVRHGIAIAQAMELLPRTREASVKALVAEHDPIADAQAMERLADHLQRRVSPLVAIETPRKRPLAGQSLSEPETLFCDLSGVTHLFESEAGVLDETHRCLSEFGLVAKLAIADNAAAAWAHAHYHPREDFVSENRVSDLHPLHVCGLRLETETYHTLGRLGIETIGALLRLPRGGLARRLGGDLVRRIAEVLGEVDVPLDAFHPEPEHVCRQELEYPTDDLEIIGHRIETLCDRLVSGLEPSGRGVLRLRCQLHVTDREPSVTHIALFSPTLDLPHLAGLVQSSVEALRIASPITQLELAVVQSGPLRTQQPSLFAGDGLSIDDSSVAKQSLARLVDALSIRLGRQAVMGVRMTDNPLPEKAYRTYSLTDHRTRKALRRLPSKRRLPSRAHTTRSLPTHPSATSRQPFRSPGKQDARRRPLKLLRQPVPLTVSETDQSPLPVFRTHNQLHRAAFHWGPERIETAWWEGPCVRRDYFRVETDTGCLWWIFQDVTTGRWFLHGRFA